MQIHDVLTAPLSNKRSMRVGRGSGSGKGKTCGRGREGARSRSGWSLPPGYEGGQMPLFRRIPKRGFNNGRFRVEYAEVNLRDLNGFAVGAEVGPDEMRARGVLRGNKHLPVKVLGDGELTVALVIKADHFTKSALAKVKQAGGKAVWVKGEPKKAAPDFRRLAKSDEVAQKVEELRKAGKKKHVKGQKDAAGQPSAQAAAPANPSSKAKGKTKPAEDDQE
jgi:large subunit ribosomal protein L15